MMMMMSLTFPGIEPRSPKQLTNSQTTTPMNQSRKSFSGTFTRARRPPHPSSSIGRSQREVYILPALITLFHNANVLVKALTLLFAQIFAQFLGKYSKCDCKNCSVIDIRVLSWLKRFSSSSISFSCSVTPVVYQKVCNYSLQRLLGG